MHKIFYLLSIAWILCLSLSVNAYTLANQQLEQIITLDDQTQLTLNGAGIRKKYFIDIYIAALYLETPTKDLNKILYSNNRIRISLFFLYDTVSAEKLREGWLDGFIDNNAPYHLATMQTRLNRSLGLLQTMHSGDRLYLDYIPDQGTFLSINDASKGFIPGRDFFQAILKIWLGEKPAYPSLKEAMLGI
ncbi:MAG: chalcone isomerase family protein [Gammaproteobacteria bacterium]